MDKNLFLLLLLLFINVLYTGIIVIEIRAIKNWRKLQSTKQATLHLSQKREVVILRILLLAVILCSMIFSAIYTCGANSIFETAKYALLFVLFPPYGVFSVLAVIVLNKNMRSDKGNNCQM